MNRKVSYRTKLIIIITLLLLAADFILGSILITQSARTIKDMIDERMVDIVSSAAAKLDGDELEKLTAEDEDTPEYKRQVEALRVFQDNITLKYIYCINIEDDGSFTFSIDPTLYDPGEFGTPVVYTEALYRASQGETTVDKEPYEDEWGRFYSAYAPVYNSAGKVVNVVAVDFDADWYNDQIIGYAKKIAVISALSLLAGIFLVIALTSRTQRQFRSVNNELGELAEDISDLAVELGLSSDVDVKARDLTDGSVVRRSKEYGDEIGKLGDSLREVHDELREYIRKAHDQADVDGMTGVGNKAAYLDVVKGLNEKIKAGTADFAIAIMDINGLKHINDNFGHASGDRIIKDAAAHIMAIFGKDAVFRIGGDEFMVIREKLSCDEMEALFGKFDERLITFNEKEKKYHMILAVSKGMAVFDRENDEDFRPVFKRADEAMYLDKAKYYEKHEDRRYRGAESIGA